MLGGLPEQQAPLGLPGPLVLKVLGLPGPPERQVLLVPQEPPDPLAQDLPGPPEQRGLRALLEPPGLEDLLDPQDP